MMNPVPPHCPSRSHSLGACNGGRVVEPLLLSRPRLQRRRSFDSNDSFDSYNMLGESSSTIQASNVTTASARRSRRRSSSTSSEISITPSTNSLDCIDDVGIIYPSDVAYIDTELCSSHDNSIDLTQATLHSFRKRSYCDQTKEFVIKYNHVLKYRDEIVWILQTVCYCKQQSIYGEISTCSISEGESFLRVRITHKRSDNNGSFNDNQMDSSQHSSCTVARDKYIFDLEDIIRRSSEEYQNEFA